MWKTNRDSAASGCSVSLVANVEVGTLGGNVADPAEGNQETQARRPALEQRDKPRAERVGFIARLDFGGLYPQHTPTNAAPMSRQGRRSPLVEWLSPTKSFFRLAFDRV